MDALNLQNNFYDKQTGEREKSQEDSNVFIKCKNQPESSQDAETDGFLRGNLFSQFGAVEGT